MEERWNDFVEAFEELEEYWGAFQEELREVESSDELSVQGQKIYGLATTRSKFSVAIPRLIDYARRSGGLRSLAIKEIDDAA